MTEGDSKQPRRFYLVMCLLSAATILVGFGNVYGPKVVAGTAEVPGIIHVHAAVFGAWVALLVAQVILVARRRTDLHRRLGMAGAVLLVAMLVVGLLAAIEAARIGHSGIPGLVLPSPAAFLLLNVNSLFTFCALAGLAIALRRNPAVHKRLMLTATVVGLVPPGAARLPIVGPTPLVVPIVLGLVLAGPIHEAITQRRRPHAAWWGTATIILVLPPVVAFIGSTGAWESIAAAMMEASPLR